MQRTLLTTTPRRQHVAQYPAALLCAVQQSIDISCRQQRLLLWLMLEQTDGRTDGHPAVS